MALEKMTERLVFVSTPTQRRIMDKEAERQGINLVEYLRQAFDFYSEFDIDFLKQIQPMAKEMRVPLPILMQNLLMAYIATERAAIDVFKVQPKTFQRAFQTEGTKLITTRKLSDIVYSQAKKDASAVKERLEMGVRDNKPVHITTAQAAFIGSHVAAPI